MGGFDMKQLGFFTIILWSLMLFQSPLKAQSSFVAGDRHLCWIGNTKKVRCIGDNSYGKVESPQDLSFESLSASRNITCGLTTDEGRIKCWGEFSEARMRALEELADINGYSVSYSHVCAWQAHGEVRCSGVDLYGEVVRGTIEHLNFMALGPQLSCAFTTTGTHCSGFRAKQWATRLQDSEDWQQIRIGAHYSCGLRKNGQLKCWGNWRGEEDLGNSKAIPKPHQTKIRSFAIGQHHACALDDMGELKCWGHDFQGAVTGWQKARENIPRSVRLKDVAVGDGFSCASYEHHRRICWGRPLEHQEK